MTIFDPFAREKNIQVTAEMVSRECLATQTRVSGGKTRAAGGKIWLHPIISQSYRR